MTTTLSRRLLTGALLAVLAPLAACSDDPPTVLSKEQFISQIRTFDDASVDPGVASCVYDNVKQDRAVMADLGAHGADNDQISQASSDKLGRLLARCIRGAESATTTTSPPSGASTSTTTTTTTVAG